MTTSTPTLTDRYIEATLRRVPSRQRPDIERELRTSIADAVDDRLEAGATPAEAEVAVLTDLGEPARLAAGYADRPLHLIGPGFYVEYTKLLRVLLVTVVPAAAAGVGLARVLLRRDASAVVGDAVGAGFTAALHVVFWTTVLFTLVERARSPRPPTRRWTPDALPEPVSRRTRYAELIAETVAMVVFTSFILISPVLRFQTDGDGHAIGLLDPWLWDSGLIYAFLGLLVVSLGLSFAKYYVNPSIPLAIGRAAVELATGLTLIWLAVNDHILNPAFVAAAGWSAGATRWTTGIIIVICIGSLVSAVVNGLRDYRQR
ncbi:permease prefix domain 1-containing protein [Mangrovihabitans endophyticus]|uniref:permease prefix domain 1-containing protein n=1 Tax=Mangrovihabitans endophyticus TaxID=1751298 RepID=UPI001662B0AC|nr:permease prefix domain 1-containing protein [Mangrovihabitans endophyticus]